MLSLSSQISSYRRLVDLFLAKFISTLQLTFIRIPTAVLSGRPALACVGPSERVCNYLEAFAHAQ